MQPELIEVLREGGHLMKDNELKAASLKERFQLSCVVLMCRIQCKTFTHLRVSKDKKKKKKRKKEI